MHKKLHFASKYNFCKHFGHPDKNKLTLFIRVLYTYICINVA